MIEFCKEQQLLETRKIPVLGEYDVAVIGGGLAGVSAALAAARAGANTALAEPNTFLGGAMLAGSGVWDDCPGGFGPGTLAGEILARLTACGGSPGLYEGRTHGDREWLPHVLLELVKASGIRLYLHSMASGLLQEQGAVQGALLTGKYGTKALLAKHTIDATGNGILAAQAGFAAQSGPKAQASAAVGFGRVDLEKTAAYAAQQGLLKTLCREENSGRILRLELKTPFEAPDLLPSLCMVSNLPGRVTQLAGLQTPLNGEDSREKAAACIRLCRATGRLAEWLKAQLPGFEESFVDWTTSIPAFDHGRRFCMERPVPGFALTGRAVAAQPPAQRSGFMAGQNAAAALQKGGCHATET